MATILDGREFSRIWENKVKERADRLKAQGVIPGLAMILVGEDPSSKIYIKTKKAACKRVGIRSDSYTFPEETSENELVELINKLNRAGDVHGIIVELPLPGHIDELRIARSILPEKDVDGLNPINIGLVPYGRPLLAPCTANGIITFLEHYGISVAGKHAVIVNRSNLVGRPLAQMLLNRDATVTICHSKTPDVQSHTRLADILVTAVGRRPKFVLVKEMVKEGVVAVDVGLSRVKGKLYGDLDFDEVKKVASFITPVPGGVGPVTVASLLHNTTLAAELSLPK